MKKYLALILALALLLTGCGGSAKPSGDSGDTGETAGDAAELGGDDVTFGESLEALGAYAGYFEEDVQDITVTCVSGTPGAYTLEGSTLTFSAIGQDSVYSVSGKLRGNIVIDVGDDHKFDLEMQGLSLVSDTACPVTVLSGDEVSLTAKNEYDNYIYDEREAVDEADETAYSGAVYSTVDLEVCGKGSLTLVSESNNGIHSKDDLQVKNLTLLVACMDNALKGNDSAEIESGSVTLIAAAGDGIKTTNSDVSDKGNQRGTVTVSGGSCTVYAACDGIDAAYDVVVEGKETVLNIYTDKYSNYSGEVTAVSEDSYYIRFTSDSYRYSVKYYNSDDDYCWVNAEYHSTVSGGRSNYYYYSFPRMADYSKLQFFIYSADQTQGQDADYLVASDYMTPSTGYDTFALSSRGSSLSYSWTNYTTNIQEGMGGFGGFGGHGGPGGMGGMNGGNTDKGSYSTKGIKANNQITVSGGTVNIKSYDDAIHANTDETLENGETPLGNVTVSGGNVTVYSNDDGLHADGVLTVSGGTVTVSDSYEGIEGTTVDISGGYVSVKASDDGINSTATSGTGVAVSGGKLYIYCSGDGIDANSRSSYTGIVFSGGTTVVISTSGGNSAIDTEQGYSYLGGAVLAVMPSGGMTGEATHCQNFDQVATSSAMNLRQDSCLTVTVGGSEVISVQMPTDISGRVIYLGSNSASLSTAEASSS